MNGCQLETEILATIGQRFIVAEGSLSGHLSSNLAGLRRRNDETHIRSYRKRNVNRFTLFNYRANRCKNERASRMNVNQADWIKYP